MPAGAATIPRQAMTSPWSRLSKDWLPLASADTFRVPFSAPEMSAKPRKAPAKKRPAKKSPAGTRSASGPAPLIRLRKLCLALPEAHEVEAWGEPTFRVRNKLFAMYAAASNHHGAGHHAVWIKARPENQDLMVRSDPDRFFVPPYVGPSGWIGVRLDGRPDWSEVADLLRDAWLLTAPPKLKRVLDGQR
jgi:hypothetical protein